MRLLAIEKKVNSTIKIKRYYKPSDKERKILKKSKELWWLGYPDVNANKAPAGHAVATGRCHFCKTLTEHIYTSCYGSNINPACHRCWCKIVADDD